MSLLQDVVDLDNVASFNPLAFDFGTTLVRGGDAIIRRVLYLWCTYLGTLRHAPGLGMLVPVIDLEARTFSALGLQGMRATMITQAKEVAFVDDCSLLPLAILPNGTLPISSTVTLTDNKAYALELSVGGARPVLLRLGSQTS